MSDQTTHSSDADRLRAIELLLTSFIQRLDKVPGGLKAASFAKDDAMAAAEAIARAEPGSGVVQAVKSLTSRILFIGYPPEGGRKAHPCKSAR